MHFRGDNRMHASIITKACTSCDALIAKAPVHVAFGIAQAKAKVTSTHQK